MFTLYYNSAYPEDRQLAAYARNASIPVKTINVLTEQPDERIISRLSNKLRMPPVSMVNKTHPYFRNYIDPQLIRGREWLELLVRRPLLLRTPIGESTDTAFFLHNRDQLRKLIEL